MLFFKRVDLKGLIGKTLECLCTPVPQGVQGRLVRFLEELERWNRRVNLVGVKDMERICRELLADALFLNAYVNGRRCIVDLGSGSGILGAPIAILNEGITVHSVDSSLKKIQFQRHVRRVLGLSNYFPLRGRIEIIDPLGADGIIAKAFGSTESILAAADRHLAAEGLVFIVKGKDEQGKDHGGYRLEKALSYELPDVPKTYRFFVYKKIS